MRFGGDEGIILELNNNGDWNSEYLRVFSCSWISSYHGEEEWLMMGGRYRMRMGGVIDLSTRADYKVFFHALFYFDAMLNGSEMEKDTESDIQKRDCRILEALIRHKMKRQNGSDGMVFNEYVHQTFDAFCSQKRQVIFNWFVIEKHFDKMRYLIQEEYKICSPRVFKLFGNLESVVFITTNRIPWRQYPFNLQMMAALMDQRPEVTFTVKADWETSYSFHMTKKSWLQQELYYRSPLHPQKYNISLETHSINNKFPQDVLTCSNLTRNGLDL